MTFNKIPIFLLFFIFGCGSDKEKSVTELYPMPWRETQGNEIITIGRALVKNKITVCGEYVVRPSAQYEGEYLVACTLDGKNYTYFLVWVGTDKVMGGFDDKTIQKPQ
jgi:hypothetical protein